MNKEEINLQEVKKKLVKEILSLKQSIDEAKLPLDLSTEIMENISESSLDGNTTEDCVKALILCAFSCSLNALEDKHDKEALDNNLKWFQAQSNTVSTAVNCCIILSQIEDIIEKEKADKEADA